MVAAFAAWFIHLQAIAAQVPLAAGAAPQAIVAGSTGGGSAGTSVTPASSLPLDRVEHA